MHFLRNLIITIMQHFKNLKIIVVTIVIFSGMITAQQKNEQILFCYGDLFPEKVTGYDYLIVEPAYFSGKDVSVFKENNKKVLAYISLGEVDKGSWYYPKLVQHTIGENKIWDSNILDLENPKTTEVLFELIETYMTVKGYDGLFLDNIDNFSIYGPTPHQKSALTAFLKQVKTAFPDIFMMQNAGVEIIADTCNYVDAIGVESVATDFDFTRRKYRLRDEKGFTDRVKQLSNIETEHKIPIILIEYADTKLLHAEIINRIKDLGWSYFIGRIELQNIPKY